MLEQHGPSDWIVGNPPYVRIEDLPRERLQAYRTRWSALHGRADVYVGFIHAGLEALQPGGIPAFLCADRWMKSQYGKVLRRQIEASFAVDALFSLHESHVFEQRVNAYPSAFAISAGEQGPALVVDADGTFGADSARQVMI